MKLPQTLLAAAAAVLLAVAGLAQGGLTPSLAPAPTMKAPDQIEARIPIGTPGTTLTSTTVDFSSIVGTHSSLAIGTDGQRAISYHDGSNADLKFARTGIIPPAP